MKIEKQHIDRMWQTMRKHDSTIPDDVLDAMRDTLTASINECDHVWGTLDSHGYSSDVAQCMKCGEFPSPVQGEVIGESCVDGGKCNHKCRRECFRRRHCGPLSGYKGQWEYDQ